jgi:hypothetical protein
MSFKTCTSALVLALSLVESVTALPTTSTPGNIKHAQDAALWSAFAETEGAFWVPAGPAYRVPDVPFYSNYTGGASSGGREPTPSISLVMPTFSTATTNSPTSSSTKRRRSRVRLSDDDADERQHEVEKRAICSTPPRAPTTKLLTLLQAQAGQGILPPWRLYQLEKLESAYALAASAACASTSTSSSSTTAATTTTTSAPTSPSATTTSRVPVSTTASSPRPVTTTTRPQTTTTTATTTTTTTTTTSRSTTTSSKPSTTSTKPTTTPSPKPTGITSWKQKTWFYSLASFLENVVDKQNWSWGDDNVAVVGKGVPAHEWTGGVAKDTDSALQVAYPKGSRNPSATPVGGMGFYSSKRESPSVRLMSALNSSLTLQFAPPVDISTAHNVSFSYSVFFPTDFDFVKGGKLPGLYGGAKACSGGSAAQSCWSARLMFRTGGMGELYLYAPREKQVDALCTIGPLSYCNSVYGMSIGRGSWTFKRGEWSNIRQDIWLNTPGKPDGGFNIWSVVAPSLLFHSFTCADDGWLRRPGSTTSSSCTRIQSTTATRRPA